MSTKYTKLHEKNPASQFVIFVYFVDKNCF